MFWLAFSRTDPIRSEGKGGTNLCGSIQSKLVLLWCVYQCRLSRLPCLYIYKSCFSISISLSLTHTNPHPQSHAHTLNCWLWFFLCFHWTLIYIHITQTQTHTYWCSSAREDLLFGHNETEKGLVAHLQCWSNNESTIVVIKRHKLIRTENTTTHIHAYAIYLMYAWVRHTSVVCM